MRRPSERTTASLYNYTDKSVPQAGYAAITFGVISLVTGLVAWFQYFLYHTPSQGSVLPDRFAAQQYLQHTALVTAANLIHNVGLALVSGVLAFFIFRRSRVAVVFMLAVVILLQLYTWIVARSVAGTLVSIIVLGFLLRGARRMFQDHAEDEPDVTGPA